MVNWNKHADDLLLEFDLCMRAKPMHNAIGIQLEKDVVSKFGYNLSTVRSWGTPKEIEEACALLEPRLDHLKQKLVFEILKSGPVKH